MAGYPNHTLRRFGPRPFAHSYRIQPKKPLAELQRDLSIIATIQAVCLAGGSYVVYAERPIALVYSDGRFFSMSADDYHSLGMRVPAFDGIPGSFPKYVMVDIPKDFTAQAKVRKAAIDLGVPLRALADRYVPLDLTLIADSEEAISEEKILQRDKSTGDLKRWLVEHGGGIDDYSFFTYGARYGYLILGISKKTRRISGLMDTGIRTEGELRAGN